MNITYYASIDNMGDVTEQEADQFRNWAQKQIETKYPDADVNVVNEGSLDQTVITGDIEHQDEETIADFCSRLWDRCPWDFEE